jgi:CBS domain-containing protein
LQESSRDADIVARVGGEEFCVLLTETGEEQATVWAERLRAQIAAAPIVVDGTTLSVTASLGVAQVTEDVENAAQIVMRADQCLLAAKQSGRDRVVGFEELQRIRAACRDPENAAGLLFAGVVARDVMSTIVASLPMDATIGWAARYFVRFRFASAPVVDANRKLAGFLSEKDVMNVLLWPDWWNRKVSDVMKTNVVCYEEGAPMLPIYEFLCRMPIRSVVVTRQGRPTGMISRGALLRWVGNAALAHRNRHVPGGGATSGAERRQLALTAAAISKQIRELQTALDGDLTDNVTPQIVGGASRIQELVNDLLACGQQFGAAAARQRDNDAFVSDDAGGLQLADCSPTAADTNGISSAT